MKKLNLQRVPSKDNRRGAVLLVAMGILALLAIFAITFANLVSLEKNASRNYVDSIRARMIARAGLERAIAELRSVAETKTHDDTRPLAAGGDPWIYRQRYSAAFKSLSTTAQLSFPMSDNVYKLQEKDANGKPKSTPVTFVSSGRLGASYANGMDAYRLKILDCASMIHVNGNDTAALERMLKNLLIAHGLQAADATTIATRVRTRRPGAGYRTKSELGMIMKQTGGAPFVTDALWPDVRDDLTCFSWQDNKVIQPPRATTSAGSTTTSGGTTNARLNLTERAPVNMNTASVEVLTAVLAELAARKVTFTRTYNGSVANKTASSSTVSISFAEAQNLATAIVLRRQGSGTTTSTEVPGGPFKSWFEFECWLDNNLSWATGSAAVKALKADLVRSMANPNTDIVLHKWGLEGNHIFRWAQKAAGSGNIAFIPTEPREVDKTDMTAITTEMCFSSMGFFEITSLGQVWNSGSIVNPGQPTQEITLSETVAETSITSVVQVFNVLRLTTQRDFERDREYLDPKLYLKYNDGSLGSVSGFTDLASEKGDWPATLTQPEYSNKHSVPDISAGSTTSTSNSSGADFFTLSPDYEPASYDGQIILNGLARIKATDPDFLCGYARGKLKPLKVRYYENDVSRWSNPTPQPNDLGRDIAADQAAGKITESDTVRNQSTKVKLFNSEPTPKRSLLNPGGNVNDLFFGAGLTNLGVMLTDDRERYLVYSGNNLDLRQGTIHFWVKPLRSPLSTQKEVYFSWLGGPTNDGRRDCGIEIFRERNLDKIEIVARFYGLNGGIESEDRDNIRFPVGFVDASGTKLKEDSFWKPGQWNHIQLAFGVDTRSSDPKYTANLIVNSQEMLGGPQEVSIYDPNGSGVRHGYVLTFRPPPNAVEAATTTALRGTGKRGNQFFWPWLPYDYYYCDAGGTSSSQITVTRQLSALRNPNSHGQYMPQVLPKNLSFPADVTDKEVIIDFVPGPHTPQGAVPPSSVNASPPEDPYNASTFPVTSENPPGPGEYFYNPTQDVRNNKWKLQITLKWKESVENKGSVCPDCRNCQDCSSALGKDPTAFVGSVGYHCFNRFPVSQGSDTTGECDDCEGCEACDVDGPIFIGAELFYTGNTPVSNNVRNTNIDTDGVFNFSQALIDNLYLLGYRVDEEINAVNEVPSDRFYDQDVAKVNSNNVNGRGHKPGYKKLLTDLYGRQFKIGTVAWTGYPGYSRVEASLGGQLDPTSLLPVTITIQRWNFGLNAQSQTIDYVTGDSIQPGFLDGIMSSNPTITNTNVNPFPGYQPLARVNADDPDRGGVGLSPQLPAFRNVDSQDILILSVDFAPNLIAANTVSQTPVLDDVTITYFTTPKIIYTEEGVDE